MKKIYNNRTKRALVFGGTQLLPGTNVAEEIDVKKFPGLQHYLDEDEIVESEDPASAMKDANTEGTVDELEKLGKGDGKVASAAEKRRAQLDKMKAEAKAAAKAAAEAAKKAEEEENEEGKGE